MTLNLADLTEAVIDAVPDKVALVCGSESRTFAEFDAAANRIAHHLAEQGVEVARACRQRRRQDVPVEADPQVAAQHVEPVQVGA